MLTTVEISLASMHYTKLIVNDVKLNTFMS